jgi:hypothetical protein
MAAMTHLTTEQLEAGLDEIRASPVGAGTLEMIVCRPAIDEREVLETGELDTAVGLVGDSWKDRPSRRMEFRAPHPEMQLNVINARAIALIAGERDRWSLSGDQLVVDLHLGTEELPPGTRLQIGGAVIEVTEIPHTGCDKFTARFGRDAMRFVNSPVGRRLNLRGINAKVVVPGTIRAGDSVTAHHSGSASGQAAHLTSEFAAAASQRRSPT